jgi:hypothetical protein
MGLANNLNKFEWENEIPFSEEQVKRTLHALVGEEKGVSGLLMIDSAGSKQWDLTCVNPECNDIFGSYGFGQVNSIFSITVKKVDENRSCLHITTAERQGAFITGNQAYLQSECNKFIKALTYHLENPNIIEHWYNVIKPQREQINTQNSNKYSSSNGCIISLIIFVIVAGVGIGLLLAL